jgi:hypothetical protein
MPALPSLEIVGRGGLTPSAGMMIDKALFADPLLATDWRAVAFVAAPQATSARMLAATSRAGGWLVVYAGVGASGLATANNAAEPPGRSFGLDESRISVVLAGATTAPFRIDAAAETGAVAAGQRVMTARGDVARKAAPSDSTAFAVAAARGARRRHARVLAVPHCPNSPLLSDTGAMILLENSEEALRGAAGAAQKAALDISLPKGANDLQADNAKFGVRMRNRRQHQLGQGRASRGRCQGQIGYPDSVRCRQHARSRDMAHGRGRTDDEALRRAAIRRINKRREPERGRVA